MYGYIMLNLRCEVQRDRDTAVVAQSVGGSQPIVIFPQKASVSDDMLEPFIASTAMLAIGGPTFVYAFQRQIQRSAVQKFKNARAEIGVRYSQGAPSQPMRRYADEVVFCAGRPVCYVGSFGTRDRFELR
jgi:hypothetical protein